MSEDFTVMPEKDPDNIEPYFVIWCSPDGTNDGSEQDNGELQGAEIDTVTWEVPAGITKDSEDTDAVSIKGVDYPVDTVCTIWLSGGTVDTDYRLRCRIVTNGIPTRTLYKTIIIPVRLQ